MGYHLVGEVLDTCPDLSYRQFRVLIALALDARDDTRRAMPGIDTITLRAGCRSQRTALRALAVLRDRGLIKTVTRAAPPHRRAVYEILPAAASGDTDVSRESGDTDVSRERVTVPGERVTVSGRTGDTDVSPPQSSPQSYTSVPPAGAAAPPPTAPPIIAEWIKRCARRPPRAVIGQVGRQVAALLADGTDADDIRAGLAAWQAKGLDPCKLPSVVNEVMNGGGALPRRWAENRAKYARWAERARALDAADTERGELT